MAQPKEVKRYRAGQRPLWDQEAKTDKTTQKRESGTQREKAVDNRLTRLDQINDIGDEQERLTRHRRIIQEAAVIVENEEAANDTQISTTISEKEGVEEDLEKRRERARKKKHMSDEDEVEELPVEADEDKENEGGSSSVSESDSEEEEDWDQFMQNRGPRLQPRFVKKEKRQTVAEKEQMQREQEKVQEEKEKQVKERKERTRILLKEAIERERSSKINGGGVDEVAVTDEDDDEETQQNEYELWKLRELVRIRRERDEREKWRLERLEVERRRNMTDEEVATEKRKNKEGFKERKYMKYLQKYYHKGAFFNSELGEIQQSHDWTAPTGEDKWVDRTMLPKVMQVKNFGRAGRTKYTHLKNEDTSKADDPWSAATYNPQYTQKMGGTGGFDRPTKKRKIANVT